jgi:hypothetical protein
MRHSAPPEKFAAFSKTSRVRSRWQVYSARDLISLVPKTPWLKTSFDLYYIPGGNAYFNPDEVERMRTASFAH